MMQVIFFTLLRDLHPLEHVRAGRTKKRITSTATLLNLIIPNVRCPLFGFALLVSRQLFFHSVNTFIDSYFECLCISLYNLGTARNVDLQFHILVFRFLQKRQYDFDIGNGVIETADFETFFSTNSKSF